MANKEDEDKNYSPSKAIQQKAPVFSRNIDIDSKRIKIDESEV
jgi:hypothetical protein